jgi:hypothetical protein
VNSAQLMDYEVGLGVNNMSNAETEPQVTGGWFSTAGEPKFELSNLSLLSAKVTKLSQSIPRDLNPPFDLTVTDITGFEPENNQINVGSEIMGYQTTFGNTFRITRRGENYGTPRQEHVLNTPVTNQGYVFRARAVTTSGAGAESAIKVYRVDLSPPTIPTAPISDQELAGGEPSETGVFSIKWAPASDGEAGVRAYEIQERVDNDPVWKTIRMVPASQTTFLVGSNDTPANVNREPGHFFFYRVRAINQAGGTSAWSDSSAAASTGFPAEAITEVTNYPNPVDIRQGPTNIAYILNEDATVKITMFDLLGYAIREWNFDAGSKGGVAGPNVFQWDGTDSSGRRVGAGGYILRIEVIATKGSTTVIRKIGVIN